jgi:hypothetical protein
MAKDKLRSQNHIKSTLELTSVFSPEATMEPLPVPVEEAAAAAGAEVEVP